MRFYAKAIAALSAAACFAMGVGTANAATSVPQLGHLWFVMMENQSFDDVIGRDDANGRPDTPFITELARVDNLATYSFGQTHPSLPNYLATIAGSYFGVQDDNDSCYATVINYAPCHAFDGANLTDELEMAHIPWVVYEETLPNTGALVDQWPSSSPRLYAQKHNPFVYFKDVATNQQRLKHIQPMPSMQTFSMLLNQPAYPRFSYIVPNQCHDMHGTSTCTNYDALLREGDNYVHQLVNAITHSTAWQSNSAIILTWDEDDYSSTMNYLGQECCGGGHIATIVITPHSNGTKSAVPYDQYSALRTIEEAFNLPLLRGAQTATDFSALF